MHLHEAYNLAGLAFVFFMILIMIAAATLDIRWNLRPHSMNRPIGDRIELPRDLYRDWQPENTFGNSDHHDRYRGATS